MAHTNETNTEMADQATWDQVIDRAAQFHLNMSGTDFLQRLENGEYDDPDKGPSGLMAVLPLVTGSQANDLPGPTPERAFRAFLSPIERSLRCLTLEHRFTATNFGHVRVVTFDGEPIELSNGHVTFDFHFVMALAVVPTDEKNNLQRMSTRRYIYELHEHTGGKRQQLVRWHWHPDNGRYTDPHLHLPQGAPRSKGFHVPTGRVTFEDVVGCMIGELGIPPAHDNWQAVLDENRQLHVKHRNWSNRHH